MLAAEFRIKDAKHLFFDRVKIVNRVDRARIKALSKAGAFIRRRARSSIRKPRQKRLSDLTPEQRTRWRAAAKAAKANGQKPPRKGNAPSRPGQPPRNVTGLLREWILFGYDPGPESVIVGPALLNKGTGAPATLEEGGIAIIQRRRKNGSVYKRRVRISPRPYMGPAFEQELPKFADLFRNIVV